MPRKKSALLMTVGTGVGEDREKARAGLAHAMLFSINNNNPDFIVMFGSEKSKLTVETLKELYLKEYDEELDYYEFIQIDAIDDFDEYFSAIKSKILELEKEYRVVIDYTYGTKTMTMSAAMASMALHKKLIFVTGKRDNGIVVQGTETVNTQNLFPIYDSLLLDKIENSFNANRFESAKTLLNDIVDPKINKEPYYKLIESYSYFDNVNYKQALENFDIKKFNEQWPNLSEDFFRNVKALGILNKETHKQKPCYVLASLLNNARRRFEEHRYDDAIARLYRSLELIGQIALKKYDITSSDVNIEILKNNNVDENFINYLKSLRIDGKIKIGLINDFKLLSYLDDDLGKFYIDYQNKIQNIVKFRNNSILAHGMESKTNQEYEEFKEIVLDAARVLNKDIDQFIEDTMFPVFN